MEISEEKIRETIKIIMAGWDKIAYDKYWLGYSALYDELKERLNKDFSAKELKKHLQIMKKHNIIESLPMQCEDTGRMFGRGWFLRKEHCL